MDILVSILGFILAVGILVAFHEYGHFWVARKLGVKVLRYSIGFGKPLFSWRGKNGETEYVLASIPLGGYVKMLDEREGEVDPEEAHRAFNRQPLKSRFAIVAAGPLANFLFAAVAYWAIFIVGSSELRPIVGDVRDSSPAAEAGFQVGDELLTIGNREVQTWQQALMGLLAGGLERGQLEVTVQQTDGDVRVRVLDLSATPALGEDPDYLQLIGLSPWLPRLPPVLGEVVGGGPAANAGLQVGDRVVAVNGDKAESWAELVELVQARPNQSARLSVVRDERQFAIDAELGSQEIGGRRLVCWALARRCPTIFMKGCFARYDTGRWPPLRRLRGQPGKRVC
ncbi:RIP metalloprotease RseP [Alkalilimnicola ehrlichii]|uniref:RIP metalloprotease RseP n=1 Tax=Alkalilimnicola ehrlichii TaxID=351052 RepID=UPI00269CD31B|nr:RIP metalloprotease RseP [Alkalilimnicola ehrlichii]